MSAAAAPATALGQELEAGTRLHAGGCWFLLVLEIFWGPSLLLQLPELLLKGPRQTDLVIFLMNFIPFIEKPMTVNLKTKSFIFEPR